MMRGFVGDVLKTVAQGGTLPAETAEQFMNLLMSGEISAVQTAGLIAAMAVRGETVEEIVGFARAMRHNSVQLRVPFDVVDTCGTGGDGADTFNISTASAIVAAAGGVPIAKHGNRAVSSRSGSADVLLALGAQIDLTEATASACLEETNLCFMFAPTYHPAMKHAAEPRRQLGFRTIFNILGPLTNPAGAKRQVLGVFRPNLVLNVAVALQNLGSKHALVVHGAGGIDEFSLQGETQVAELRDGQVAEYAVTPEEFGLRSAPVTDLVGGDAYENANIIRGILNGKLGAPRDVVVLNAGAALYVGGQVRTMHEGVEMAQGILNSGKAAETLDAFVRFTQLNTPSEVAQ